ncbi:MAG: hypothetical protein ABSA68_18420 [Xanthobacteraceae bacterium]
MSNVIRLADYERKSRNPDAVPLRNPADSAIIVVLPVIRSLNAPGSGEFVSFNGGPR